MYNVRLAYNMSLRIQELAVPKGNIVPPCEICGLKATTKCEGCKQTHYCSDKHKSQDYESFHKSVCEAIAYVRKEHPIPFTEEDRKAADNALLKKKLEILKLAEIRARKWLLEDNANLALPAAVNALNITKGLVKIDSIEMICPSCLVSESHLGQGDTEKAEEYMILASWASQKHDIIPPAICAKLKRLVGLVCMNAEKWQEAREAFAEAVYATAIEYGTSDIRMAVIYGHLGLSLLKFDLEEGAMSSFHKMADKWLEFLLSQFEHKTIRCATEQEILTDEKSRELEFQYMESKTVFKLVYVGVRNLGMNEATDLINFKILCVQALQRIRDGCPDDAAVYKQEALATATRTKQDKCVPKSKVPVLIELLGDDYLMRWEKKHNRPRTCATKYLEMIKAIDV